MVRLEALWTLLEALLVVLLLVLQALLVVLLVVFRLSVRFSIIQILLSRRLDRLYTHFSRPARVYSKAGDEDGNGIFYTAGTGTFRRQV